MTQPLQAHTLARLAGIRHAFFTRAGGVSGGVYASLNAGVGSDDDPHNVAANRARMAADMFSIAGASSILADMTLINILQVTMRWCASSWSGKLRCRTL